jgi:hypothetical protein
MRMGVGMRTRMGMPNKKVWAMETVMGWRNQKPAATERVMGRLTRRVWETQMELHWDFRRSPSCWKRRFVDTIRRSWDR